MTEQSPDGPKYTQLPDAPDKPFSGPLPAGVRWAEIKRFCYLVKQREWNSQWVAEHKCSLDWSVLESIGRGNLQVQRAIEFGRSLPIPTPEEASPVRRISKARKRTAVGTLEHARDTLVNKYDIAGMFGRHAARCDRDLTLDDEGELELEEADRRRKQKDLMDCMRIAGPIVFPKQSMSLKVTGEVSTEQTSGSDLEGEIRQLQSEIQAAETHQLDAAIHTTELTKGRIIDVEIEQAGGEDRSDGSGSRTG